MLTAPATDPLPLAYDELQHFARWVCWLCCRRTVLATNLDHPDRRCLVCPVP